MRAPQIQQNVALSARLRWSLLLIWLLFIPILCLLYVKIAPSPDQAQFNYMGWMATQGHPFYAGSFDMNWPGGMILHELAIALFGPSAIAWHLFDFGLLIGTTLMAALFLRRAGFVLAPYVMLALYPAIYVTAGGWMAGQRDIIAVGVLIGACCAMLAPASREWRSLAFAGALVAVAVLIRPTYLSFLAGLCLLELGPRRWIGHPRQAGPVARIGALALGFGAVMAATAIAGFWIGNIDDFYQQTVLFTMSAYVGKPPLDMVQTVVELLRSSHWMVFLGLIGLALWVWRTRRLEYPLLLLLGLSAAIALSYVVQRKGFGYHLGGVLPLLILFVGIAFDEVRRFAMHMTRPPMARSIASAALVGMVLLAASGMAAKLIRHRAELRDLRNGLAPIGTYSNLGEEEQAHLIEIMRSRTARNDRVVLYGTAYQIPYLAQRLPAYRFITPAVEQMRPDFALYPAWKRQVEDGLRTHKPKLILIMQDAVGSDPERVRKTGTDARPVLGAIIAFMSDDYAIAFKGPFGVLYERMGER
ncbi:MAG: hypothetical protein ABW164_09650 [Sphingobium sp.]